MQAKEDGNILFLGRKDNQVKIRGFRFELGEIAATLESHRSVQRAIVLPKATQAGDTGLAAYLVYKAGFDHPTVTELRDFLSARLPVYMVPGAFVALEQLPLLPSGKLDHKCLPQPEFSMHERVFVAPRNPQEEILCGIWSEVLGAGPIGLQDDFFELGGHSLLAAKLISRIRKAFDVDLPLRQLFASPTVAGIGIALKNLRHQGTENTSLSIPAQSSMEPSLLSFAQQRLWFLDRLMPGSSTYNLPFVLKISGKLDRAALRQTVQEIVRRHEVLRMRFPSVDGFPVQELVAAPFDPDDSDVLTLDQTQLEGLIQAEADQPFDLALGPLIRVRLARLNADENLLMVTMHHIVSDGWSQGVLIREFEQLYQAFSLGQSSPLPTLAIQYADYAQWQRNWIQTDAGTNQLRYWTHQLADLPVLELPTDHPRHSSNQPGAEEHFNLGPDFAKRLKAFSLREGVTVYMTALAAFEILLAKYSGQSDFGVGTPVANRNHREAEDLIGLFANTVVMRANLFPNLTVRELLQDVRRTVFEAYENQELPFEMVVEELAPDRDLTRTPLFQAMLVMQDPSSRKPALPGLEMEMGIPRKTTAMFDLTLSIQDGPNGLSGAMEYATDLFEPATIRQMVMHWRKLLELMLAGPQAAISQLQILDQQEINAQLSEVNCTAENYPSVTLQQLFEQQAARTPDAVAFSSDARVLTYAELNELSNQVAHLLIDHGVLPEHRVGILMSRSAEMIAAMLGVVKAGAAYVPMDVNYPADRRRFIAQDAELELLLIQAQWSEMAASLNGLTALALDKADILLGRRTENPGAIWLRSVSCHSVGLKQPSRTQGPLITL